MNPSDISLSDLHRIQHVQGAYELMNAIRANKPQEEIMRIILRNPRLMATLLVAKNCYYSK